MFREAWRLRSAFRVAQNPSRSDRLLHLKTGARYGNANPGTPAVNILLQMTMTALQVDICTLSLRDKRMCAETRSRAAYTYRIHMLTSGV